MTHINSYLRDFAVFHGELQVLDARKRFNVNLGFVGVSAVEHVFTYATDAVSAHHGFAAVCIENAHFEVRHRAGKNADNAIGPRAKMAIGVFDGKFFNVFGCFLAIQIQVVVSQTVHLREVHGSPSLGVAQERGAVWGAPFKVANCLYVEQNLVVRRYGPIRSRAQNLKLIDFGTCGFHQRH